MTDSYKETSFLPITTYLLKIFQGLRIGILGFSQTEFDSLKNFFEKHGALYIVSVRLNDNKYNTNHTYDIMIIKSTNAALPLYEGFMQSLTEIPVVTEKWLK